MAEIDTSFYPKPSDKSPIDVAGQWATVANSLQSNRLLRTQNEQAHMDLVKGQVDTLINGFSSLASKPDLNVGDFQSLGERLVDQGVISPDVFGAEMASLPPNATPDDLRKIATGYSLRALDAGTRFTQQFGTPGMVNTGNAQIPVTTSPLTGIHPIGSAIPNQLSPSELSTPTVIGVNENNQPVTGTRGQFLTQVGANPLTAQPEAPQAPVGGNALVPAAPQAPSGVVMAPIPGAVEAQSAVGQQSGQQLAVDRQRESGFAQNVLPLEKAIPALESLGTTGTGPGKEQVNNIFSFLQSMGMPGIDPAGIKDFDEAKKYLTQFVNMTGNSSTNDKLAASFAGNPSVEISNAAAIDVAKTALALARMENAKVRSFDGAPQQYSDYATHFSAEQDPRAYGFDLMSPKQREDLIKSLKGDEKARFVNSLRTAMQLGLVSPPAQGGANGE